MLDVCASTVIPRHHPFWSVRVQRRVSSSEAAVFGTKTAAEQGTGIRDCGFQTRQNGFEAVMELQEAAADTQRPVTLHTEEERRRRYYAARRSVMTGKCFRPDS